MRAVSSMQDRQLNAGPSSQFKAVVSIEGRSLKTGPVNSTQGRQLNAAPSSSMQRRQLSAAPSVQCSVVSSLQGRQHPSTQCRGRLFQCRHVCFNSGLSPQCRAVCLLNTETAQYRASPQCRVVPCAPCRARLLNAGPVCSTQRHSAQRKAVRSMQSGREAVSSRQGLCFNVGLFVSMQGRVFQCRAHSMQDHHFNAGSSAQRRADTSMQERLVGLTMIFGQNFRPRRNQHHGGFFFEEEEAYFGSTLFFSKLPTKKL